MPPGLVAVNVRIEPSPGLVGVAENVEIEPPETVVVDVAVNVEIEPSPGLVGVAVVVGVVSNL